MNKLYLISYFFAPLGRADGINRSYFTKYLAELGWDIEVISCRNPHGFIQSFQEDESLLDIIPPQVKLHRINSVYWGPLGGIASLIGLTKDPFGNWYYPAVKAAESIIQDRGVVYAIVPPLRNALIAFKIAKRKKLPLVLDFRDNDFGLPKEIVQFSSTVIASTKRSLDDMIKHYSFARNNGYVMYNGFTEEHNIRKKVKNNDKLNIVYAGLINHYQNPVTLIRAISCMEAKYPESKGQVSVDYYGPNNYYTRFVLRKHLSNSIRFKGYIPFHQVLEKIALADVAYSPLSSDRMKESKYCIPSKVFQYIAMETPILSSGPDGALKDFVENNRIGRFSYANDIASQVDDLFFLLKNPQERENMIMNIRNMKSLYTMRAQVAGLSSFLGEVTDSHES